MYGLRFLGSALAVLLAYGPSAAFARQQGHPAFDAPGMHRHRDYFSQMPFENIDTLSGSLVLKFTDLVLPGNAGRELRLERTYNSKTGRWSFGVAGVAMRIYTPPAPQFGGPEVTTPQDFAPVLYMSDDSRRQLAWYEFPNVNNPSTFNRAISSDFWLFDRTGSTRKLYIPNGDVCDYEHDITDFVRVKSCQDAYGNTLTFEWLLSSNPPELIVRQSVGDDERMIVITLLATSNPESRFPSTVNFDGRTWTYTIGTDGLASVVPPGGGPGWSFTYVQQFGTVLLRSVTTPHGGVVEYTFQQIAYDGPGGLPDEYSAIVVSERKTIDANVIVGTWSYQYIPQWGTGLSGDTTVTTPSGRTLYHYGMNTDYSALFDGLAGAMPLTSRVVQKQDGANWVDLEREDLTYTMVPVVSWANFGTLEPQIRTVTRDDGDPSTQGAKTTFHYGAANFGDYHHPNRIEEKGTAGTRDTYFTYKHDFTIYLVGVPLTENVVVGSASFPKSWTYKPLTGFKTSETVYGITTTLEPDAFGNVKTVTTADGKVTQYQYENGQPSKINTPLYPIERTVNLDGTIASETRAGRTTVFRYDDLGRLKEIYPPGTSHTVVTYQTLSNFVRSVRTTRGTSVITTTLDGFGRPVETMNSLGVVTRTVYDAEGRVTGEGLPTTGADLFTQNEYDALGRLTRRINSDGATSSRRTYGPDGVVTVFEHQNSPDDRATRLTWKAFGDLDDPLLVELEDAIGNKWVYEYNGLRQLVKVSLGVSTLREWKFYDQTDRLEWERHPESGQTSYGYYNDTGLLYTKTDAKGTTTSYQYDDNHRTSIITAGNRVTTFLYEPGSDNREMAINGSDAVMWLYDTATGRLRLRQDTIDGKFFTTQFEYDGNDNLRAIVYPSGRRLQYDVNQEGQPTKVYEVGRDFATGVTYHPSGGVKSYTAGNGVVTTIDYHPTRYWVSGITSGDLVLNYDNYDGVGNVQTIHDSRAGFGQTLTYDKLDRLTAAVTSSNWNVGYSYDAHGNRNNPESYEIDTVTLRLMSYTAGGVTTTFEYDNNGNTTIAGPATYSYTPQNQVENATHFGVNVGYAYDPDNQRIKKTADGSTVYYIRGLNSELLTEWKDPGTANGRFRDYIYLGSRLLSATSLNSASDPGGPPVPSTQSHRYATSWQAPDGTGGTAFSGNGASAAARKSYHPDMPGTGLRLGVQASSAAVDIVSTAPMLNATEDPKQGGVFVEFEVERYPSSEDVEWLAIDGGGYQSSSTDVLRLYITPGGQLVLKHDGGRASPLPLWTSSPVGNTAHTLEVRFEFNSKQSDYDLPNPPWEGLTSWARVYFDGLHVASYGASEGGSWDSTESQPTALDLRNGSGVFERVLLKSPAATKGLLMNVWRMGVTAAKTHGEKLDYYGSSWRTTLLQAAGPGTYSEWTGGQPDWRARSIIAGEQVVFANPVTTSVPDQKISYRIEPMLARGITGKIGTVLVGVRMQYLTANTRVFIRRNGVDTILQDFVLAANSNRWFRVAQSGWMPSDEIEIGIISGGSGSHYLHSVALLVEHNTPEPAPLTDTTVEVKTVNYTGNGGAQTVDFSVDKLPTVLLVSRIDGPSGIEPIWWWESRQGAGGMAQSATHFKHLWPQKGKFHVVQDSGNYNASGVHYVAIALFDPSGRFVIPFAASKPAAEDDYIHKLRYPQSRALASDFTPEFVFGGSAFNLASNAASASLYKGPGHTLGLTAKLGVAQAADEDRIQDLGPGTVQFGTLIGHGAGDHAFWAGRVSDSVSSTRLMAVTSYVGDGTASRNIPVDLGGSTPVLALVVPTNASPKVSRVVGDTTGRRTDSGNAVANSITAMGADQLTVGSALNVLNVTYDVWTITTGLVTP